LSALPTSLIAAFEASVPKVIICYDRIASVKFRHVIDNLGSPANAVEYQYPASKFFLDSENVQKQIVFERVRRPWFPKKQ